MLPIREDHPLKRMFTGLLDHAFCAEIGICDPRLTGYLADLLVEFVHIDQLNTIGDARGKSLDQIAAMLAVACDDQPKSESDRDRVMYRHIGDYTLFWAGVYPEHLRRSRRDNTDVLLDYVTQGKRSYGIVSELTTEEAAPPPSLFRHLSEDFEFCIYGLGLVRRGWEETGAGLDPGGELIY